ncbi:hypothetical protein JNUCC23_09455 [Peribacillus sp. JNUCC 23]
MDKVDKEKKKYEKDLKKMKKELDKKVNKMATGLKESNERTTEYLRSKGLKYWEINEVVYKGKFEALLEHGLITLEQYEDMNRQLQEGLNNDENL